MNDGDGDGNVGAGLKPAPTTMKPAPTEQTRHSLPEIVRALKTFSARRINIMHGTPGKAIWQRNYYEHIIRNEASRNRIREYVANNPVKWPTDDENPARVKEGVVLTSSSP